MATGTLVFSEATEGGKLNPVTAELIATGARLSGPVTCVLPGSGVEGLAQECVAAGANNQDIQDRLAGSILDFRWPVRRWYT